MKHSDEVAPIAAGQTIEKHRAKTRAVQKEKIRDEPARFSVDAQGKMSRSGQIGNSFVTEEIELAAVLLEQVKESLPFGRKGASDTLGLNFASQAMHSLQPEDGLEAFLSTQLVATHTLAMHFLKRVALPEQTPEGVDTNINRATRLLRTFATIAETLRGHRNSGGQKMLSANWSAFSLMIPIPRIVNEYIDLLATIDALQTDAIHRSRTISLSALWYLRQL
jgi:hypothetical protein